MPTQTTYTAEYLYPGSFFPEETFREIKEPTYEAAVEAGPNEDGYFKKDGWYAVNIRRRVERLFVDADEPTTTKWLTEKNEVLTRIIVGRLVHVDDPEIAGEEHRILRSNIQSNGKDPFKDYGVLARSGNWQVASDWDEVTAP